MKITVEKIKRILAKDYKWENLDMLPVRPIANQLIKDVLNVINNELIAHKNISIK